MTEVPGRGWSSASGAPETADVLLLRHGATRLTPQKKFSGVGGSNLELSASGREQAQRAARSTLLRGARLVEIVCSPLRRCRETAEILAAELGLRVRVEADLREMDFGKWEGLTYAEVEQRYPHDLAEWKRSAVVAPTGSSETLTGVLDRMGTVAERLATRYAGESVLALTHVTPLKALVVQALGAPPSALFRMELSPASFSRIAYTGSEASVRLFNATSHLS
jgi:ribonuclease H / adenosylcobalamin/alpha-ribazole phosphatase